MISTKLELPLERFAETYADFVNLWTATSSARRPDNTKLTVSTRIYSSPSISVYVNKVGASDYSLYVPRGVFYRLYLLIHLFLNRGEHGPLIDTMYSPRDKHIVELYIPSRLAPIFSPRTPTFDKQVQELINAHGARNSYPLSTHQAIHVIQEFILKHELSHIENYHFEIRESFENGDPFPYTEDTLGTSRNEILEGFEVHADQLASEYTSSRILNAIATNNMKSDDVMNLLCNVALAIAAFVTLCDSKNRSLDASIETGYPHPQVRFTLIVGVIAESLGKELGALFIDTADVIADHFTGYANWLTRHELAYDEANGIDGPGEYAPIAQLNRDISLLGESVLHEYMCRSIERGKRIPFVAELLKIRKPTGRPFLRREWELAPGERYRNLYLRASRMGNRFVPDADA